MAKVFTLEIQKQVCSSCRSEDVVVEVDHDRQGVVSEIRVWSEYFNAYVQVSEAWLENNFPSCLTEIYDKVSREVEKIEIVKEYKPELETA